MPVPKSKQKLAAISSSTSSSSSNSKPKVKVGESIKATSSNTTSGEAAPTKSRLRQNRATRKDTVKSAMHGNTKF